MELRYRTWEKDGSLIGFRPTVKIICPMCSPPWWMFWEKKPEMVLTYGNVFNFSLKELEERRDLEYEDRDSFAIDIWTQCPRCGYSTVHGVPLSREEFREKMAFIEEELRKQGYLKEGDKIEVL